MWPVRAIREGGAVNTVSNHPKAITTMKATSIHSSALYPLRKVGMQILTSRIGYGPSFRMEVRPEGREPSHGSSEVEDNPEEGYSTSSFILSRIR